MHNRYTWAAALALAVLLAGCKQAPPPPAPDTHDADVKAIRDLETTQVQAFAAKDVNKIGSYYGDNASVFFPDAPVVTGAAAIAAVFKPFLADKNYSLSHCLLLCSCAAVTPFPGRTFSKDHASPPGHKDVILHSTCQRGTGFLPPVPEGLARVHGFLV